MSIECEPQDPRKYEPGAYISLHRNLYYVLGKKKGETLTSCVNAKTEYQVSFRPAEIGEAELERVAPALDVPEVVEIEVPEPV